MPDQYATGTRVRDRLTGKVGRVTGHDSIRTVRVLWDDGGESVLLRLAVMTGLEVIRS